MPKKPPSSPAAGVYVALATPRRPDSTEIDTAAFLEYLDPVSAAGVNGFVFFGSTGEFVHFDLDQRMHVTGLAAKRSKLPVFVNVSHSTFSGARDLAEHAIDAGVQGLLVMPPYFYKYSENELEFFCEAMAGAVDGRLPLYLYNMPAFTQPLSLPSLERLLMSGAFAGIKDSGGDWATFKVLQAWQQRTQFQIFIGQERIYAEALRAGAQGIVSGVAAALPELIVALKRAHELKTSPELLRQLNRRLEDLLNWTSQFPTPLAIKEAAESRKWILNTVGVPLPPGVQERLLQFRNWFSEWLPSTLELCTSVR